MEDRTLRLNFVHKILNKSFAGANVKRLLDIVSLDYKMVDPKMVDPTLPNDQQYITIIYSSEESALTLKKCNSFTCYCAKW